MTERRTKRRDEATFFETAAAFRAWLEDNHETSQELWVGFFKKGAGQASVTYPEAVEEALCFGWIDGVRLTVDDETYTNRFTPRKRGSNWSAINIARVADLTQAGRMTPSGIAAFEARDQERAQYSYEGASAGLSPEYESALRARPAAWAFFEAQPPWYRRIAAAWVMDAKREETRFRRLEALIGDCEAGEWVRPLRAGRRGRGV
jgi:uncharacterized protein YdeI (YjbR/CyaY-like superfamily)